MFWIPRGSPNLRRLKTQNDESLKMGLIKFVSCRLYVSGPHQTPGWNNPILNLDHLRQLALRQLPLTVYDMYMICAEHTGDRWPRAKGVWKQSSSPAYLM